MSILVWFGIYIGIGIVMFLATSIVNPVAHIIRNGEYYDESFLEWENMTYVCALKATLAANKYIDLALTLLLWPVQLVRYQINYYKLEKHLKAIDDSN